MTNKEKFILNANIKHNNKYDYSTVNYINSQIKVKIICPEHGEFEMKPNNHTQKSGCPKCKSELLRKLKVKSTDQFINDSRKVHGDKYNYSLSDYKQAHKKIKIICSDHGIFEQKPNNHLNGQNCPKCTNNNFKSSTEEFIIKAKEIHGNKYDYSLVDYKNNKSNVKIICDGEIYEQSPKSHLKGIDLKHITLEEFIKKSNKLHGNKYDYSLVSFKTTYDYIKIICPIHGIFIQRLGSHYVCGCPNCQESKGERKIRLLLKHNNVQYKSQKSFKDCKNIKCLPFDFYLPKYNCCIEFDGIQHFEPIDFFGGEEFFKYRQKNDKIKNEYCKNNNIHLIRIRYDESVFEKLNHFLLSSFTGNQ